MPSVNWLFATSVFDLLGPPPPVSLIRLALVVYCFSALVPTLPRIVDGSDSYREGLVTAYLGAFYGFYFYARALDVNFWAGVVVCAESMIYNC